MTPGRREFLMVGGGVIATLGFPRVTLAGPGETIEMKGTARGEHVWFAPVGLAVAPGTTVRFVNRDPGTAIPRPPTIRTFLIGNGVFRNRPSRGTATSCCPVRVSRSR